MKTLKIYNTLIATIAGDTNEYHAPADDYANELFEALKKDGTDLAEYIYEDHGSIYVKEYGKKMKIELKVYDDTSDLSTMTRNLEKAIVEDQVDFILPPVSTVNAPFPTSSASSPGHWAYSPVLTTR